MVFFFSLNSNKTPKPTPQKKRQISGFFQTFLVLSKTKQALRGCAAAAPASRSRSSSLLNFLGKRLLHSISCRKPSCSWVFSVVFLDFSQGCALRSLLQAPAASWGCGLWGGMEPVGTFLCVSPRLLPTSPRCHTGCTGGNELVPSSKGGVIGIF